MNLNVRQIFFDNARFLKRRIWRPYLGGVCIRMISFYQDKLSRHTCLYTPSCSEYTKRCINNYGAVAGILMGTWRILRCNPLSKGGVDPAPEKFWKIKWLV